MLLDGQMGIAFVEEQVLEDVIRAGDGGIRIAELKGLQPVDVALLGIVMNAVITAWLYRP